MDQTQQFNSAFASLSPEQQATYQKANPTVNVGGATQKASAGGYTPSPNTFSITPTNANGAVTSDALAKTDATYGSVLNYRKNLQDAYDTYTKNSTAIQNDINSSLSMSPEEQAAQKSLADIQNKELATNVDARRRQDEIRKNENGLFGGGLQTALAEDARKSDAQLADIAVQRFAASNTLQALTGVRTSKLDALKTKLGFEDTRFEKLLGIEQEFRGMTKDEKAQARTDLSTILEYSNGLDWNELTPDAQQSITNAVANTNLSLDAVKQSLARNKIAYTEERTKNRLANQLTQSNIDKNNAEAAKNAPKTGGVLPLAQAKSSVDSISSLVSDPAIRSAVGPTGIARFIGRGYDTATGARQNFIAGIEQVRSNLNLESLINAKARGATFGALSDQELQVLSNSATKIGSWAIKDSDGNVTGYRASEKDFTKELDKINNFAKLDYILRGGSPDDVGAKVQTDGSVWTKNSDGTLTQIK